MGRYRGSYASLLDMPNIKVSSGRAAIALALQHARVGDGDEVLVPAYHCESMISPIRYVGALPVFYRVTRDTAVDLVDLEAKITPQTRVILATHYFGFPQAVGKLRELCDRYGILLVEDCAHAFFGTVNGAPIGAFGDYSVGSAMKFFPLFDGGLLASSRHDLSSLRLFHPSLRMQLKGSIAILEYALRYGRLNAVRVPLQAAMAVKDIFWNTAKRLTRNRISHGLSPASSQGGYTLEPQWINARISRISELILSHTRMDRIGDRRRENYELIVTALSGVPGIQPLFSRLPNAVVPLVVPMLLDDPLTAFSSLKNAGVPIWRFGEYLDPAIDDTVCTNAAFLSKHVLQFPCHSELRRDEIDWMIATIRAHLAR